MNAWNKFWFQPGDPTMLGFIRICCGLILLYVHIGYSYDLQEFLGPQAWLDSQIMDEFRQEAPVVGPPLGWEESPTQAPQSVEEELFITRWGTNPRQAAAQGHYIWSIWFYVTNPVSMWLVHGAVLLILFLFTIGFWTRITSVLAWAAVLSYIHRAPTSLFGMDTMTNILTLYLMIGPSGAALSVDRLVARRLGPPEFTCWANFALRLIQVHFCIIYFVAGISKLQGATWWAGTAVWGTLANYEFSPIRFEYYYNSLRFLTQNRWLWEMIMTSMVVFTLAFEIAFPFCVWSRKLRWTMVLSAVLLHLGIGYGMGLTTFSLIMLTGVASFLPAECIHETMAGLKAEYYRRTSSAGKLAGAPFA